MCETYESVKNCFSGKREHEESTFQSFNMMMLTLKIVEREVFVYSTKDIFR